MELNDVTTNYGSAASSQDDDLARRIRLFKAELDKIAATSERLPFKEGDILSWAKELFRK